MLNRLHSLFHRPELGWDPISIAHADDYSQLQRASDLAERQVDSVEKQIGTVRGKRVLDLGAGPGRQSVVFASRGAIVTWHDVSSAYLDVARAHASASRVEMQFSLGYLEAAAKFLAQPFDLVFCSNCWCYSMDDRYFAGLIYALVGPGAAGYVRTPTIGAEGGVSLLRHACYRAYLSFDWKIGHLYPPRGKVARLFDKFPLKRLSTDYSDPSCDEVLFVKLG